MKSIERFALGAACVLAVMAFVRSGAVPQASAGLAEDGGPVKIAVCAAVKIVDELMDSDRYKPARAEMEDALRKEKLEPIVTEGRELQKSLEGMARDDPKFAETREKLMRLQRDAERATREVAQKIEAKVAEQLVECYGLVRASAAAVAAQQGYTHVLSSGGSEEPPKTEVVLELVRDFLSRPVLVAPEGNDISDDVRRDLKIG